MDSTDILTPDNLSAFAGIAVDAAKQGNSAMLISLAVVVAVWLVRKYLGPKIPFLQTKRGGAILGLLTSLSGGVASTLASGKGWSWDILVSAAKIAFTAAGGWMTMKHLIFDDVDPGAIKTDAKQAGADATANVVPLTIVSVIDAPEKTEAPAPTTPTDGSAK